LVSRLSSRLSNGLSRSGRPSRSGLGACLLVLGAMIVYAGCKPDYPACDADSDCKPKEFCVSKKCQQCRGPADCPEGTQCNAGKCGAIPGFCREKAQCPGGEECIANRCRACTGDGECPTGMRCISGACKRPTCSNDDQCAQDQECQNGFCVPARAKAVAGACPLEPVFFEFDSASLSPEGTAILGKNGTCLKTSQRPVHLVGHADPRGTPEYNMALSDRRAQAAKDYLQRLGIPNNRLVPVPRGELDSAGADESGWARDRRVDSEWQ
jgi:peptidoglycan-associated lipoprotein